MPNPLIAYTWWLRLAVITATCFLTCNLTAQTEKPEAEKTTETKTAETKSETVQPYSQKSSKGKTYYLFSREQKLKNSDKTVTMYYFAKDPKNSKGKPMAAVPADREVSETKTGMLVLKKKVK